MSSAGAQCNHINHVSTQMPYALTCAAVSAVTYIIAGLVRNPVISLVCGLIILFAVMMIFKIAGGKPAAPATAEAANENAAE
jgi:Na+/H+ antiporter NhaC